LIQIQIHLIDPSFGSNPDQMSDPPFDSNSDPFDQSFFTQIQIHLIDLLFDSN
jgi:hypothetical protein